MKRAFDEKVTPYKYEVGTVVLLNDRSRRLEFPGNYEKNGSDHLPYLG